MQDEGQFLGFSTFILLIPILFFSYTSLTKKHILVVDVLIFVISLVVAYSVDYLYLNNGIYNNVRIISEEYLNEMTQSYVSLDYRYGNQDYGYLWWLPHRTNDVVAAIGDGGNVIYINKKYNIVVGITGYFKPMIFDRIEYIEKNVVEALIK